MNKTTLPLTPQQMVEFFKDKDQQFIVDFDETMNNINSTKFILMYIANLGLTCNIDKVNDDLLYEYMTLTEFTNINNLQRVHANVLYLGKYGEVLYDDVLPLFGVDDMIAFIQKNPFMVQTQMAFLNSIPLFLSAHNKNNKKINSNQLKTDQLYPEIGFSLMLLFGLSDFLLSYLRQNVAHEDQIYFTRYFDEYMYGGVNLFGLFNVDTNSYMGLIQLLTDAANNKSSRTKLNDMIDTMTNMLSTFQSNESFS